MMIRSTSRLLLFSCALFTGLAVGAAGARAAEPKGHPLIEPYPGSTLSRRESPGFTEYKVIVGTDPKGKTDDEILKSTPVSGELTRLFYENPKDASGLEIFANYKEALAGAGFELLFECVGRRLRTELGLEPLDTRQRSQGRVEPDVVPGGPASRRRRGDLRRAVGHQAPASDRRARAGGDGARPGHGHRRGAQEGARGRRQGRARRHPLRSRQGDDQAGVEAGARRHRRVPEGQARASTCSSSGTPTPMARSTTT